MYTNIYTHVYKHIHVYIFCLSLHFKSLLTVIEIKTFGQIFTYLKSRKPIKSCGMDGFLRNICNVSYKVLKVFAGLF